MAVWMCLLIYGLLSERRYLWAAMVLPFLAFLHPEVQNRVMDLFQGNTPGGYRKLNSFAWRKELWKSALPWIQERPWFGYGLASFKPTTLQFFKNAVGSGSGAHNTYLEIAFEMGLAGLLPFLLLFKEYVFRFFSAMKKLKGGLSKRYAIMVAFVLSYMIICTSDNLLHYLTFNWYFWFFTGLMLKSYFLDSANKTT